MERRKPDISDWIDPPSDDDVEPEGYVEAVNAAIEQGRKDIAAGRFKTLEEIKRKFGYE